MTYQPGESGNPDGRPKITLDDLPDGWVEAALKLYGEGGSDVEVRAFVFGGMSNDLWTRLLAEESLFSETVERGRELAKAWWYSAGRTALYLDKFQNGPYALHMKNRFGWADKTATEHSGSINMATKEQRDAAVAAARDADA
jgi:hypothetical protein